MSKFIYKNEFEFEYGLNTFKPTSTSELLLETILKDKSNLGKTLDIGTGVGFIILMLDLYNKIEIGSCASDLSQENIKFCKINSKNFKSKIEIKLGSLFEPWQNYKFDTIINDISGVVPKIAAYSGWFNGVPIECGEDGADLTIEFLEKSLNYLEKFGILYTPILSLQNENRIFKTIDKMGLKYEVLSSKYWFLPEIICSKVDLLTELTSLGYIRLEKKFGRYCWYTSVLRLERV